MMTDADTIFEKHAFFSTGKFRTIYTDVLERVFSLQLADIFVEYADQPDERFSSLNDRTMKILLNMPKPEKITRIEGHFADGGEFSLIGGMLAISVLSDQYNYDLIEAMKNFLSPLFPVCVFQNPYIWGVNLYQPYERDLFFEARRFAARSRLLEDPEVDIFRRDDGIIYKFRFHLKNEMELDEGIRFLEPIFVNLLEALQKGALEGIEVLHLYCTDRSTFRTFSPRTKMGKELKGILGDN